MCTQKTTPYTMSLPQPNWMPPAIGGLLLCPTAPSALYTSLSIQWPEMMDMDSQ